ncbi:hypothetical protein JOF29_004225 [Kribbella aluminosa]|uniref:Thioredoxin family protein n=1 Tax=Kribbella aluminosa TaxID=416017 RepID=A0ABS4UNC1_9ACTN|nr:hypothetical protein [Kribbella aluminosa]MBP2353142.1 hypothetical protein [Kribbella aluminosa]
MRLEVLHVADCPHLSVLLDRLAQAADHPVTTRLIETTADAEHYGMSGSPTLLVDGTDPFGPDGQPSLSCRLYRDEAGRPTPVPSVDQVRAAVTEDAG